MAVALVPYRWAFILLAMVWLAVGFKLNVLQRASRTSRLLYWSAVALTAVTILHWGWWQF